MPTIQPILPTPGQSQWGDVLNRALDDIVEQTNLNAGIVEGVGALAIVRQHELTDQVNTAVSSHGVAAAASVAVTARDQAVAAQSAAAQSAITATAAAQVLDTTDTAVEAVLVDPTSAASAVLSTTFARAKKPGTFVALGDSQTGVDNGFGVLWPQTVQALSGRKLSLLANAGIGGNTTAQMLARVQTDVIDRNPSACVFLGGVNDILAGVAPATTHNTIAAIADAVTAAGIEFIIGTVPPRNAHTGGVGVSIVRNLNDWIKTWAPARGYRVIPFNAALANPRNGEYLAGMSFDATHPNALGMIAMAQAAVVVLTATGPTAALPSLAPVEGEVDYLSSFPATIAYPNQLVRNPLLWDLDNDLMPETWESRGVATIAVASLAGATSLQITAPLTPGTYRVSFGQVQAETVTITTVTGAAAPYTANLSAPAANPHPAKHMVDTAALTLATVSTDTRFVGGRACKITATAQTGAVDILTHTVWPNWAVGDKLRLVLKLALDTPTAIPTGKGVEVKLRFVGPGTTVAAVQKWAYATPAGLAAEFAADAVVPAGTTGVQVVTTVDMGGGSAVVYVGQVGTINLTATGTAATVLPV